MLFKKPALIAVSAIGLLAAPASAVTPFAGNGHLYEFVATTLSWQGALAAAAAATPIAGYTAHLVTITAQAEDDFLKTLTGSATCEQKRLALPDMIWMNAAGDRARCPTMVSARWPIGSKQSSWIV